VRENYKAAKFMSKDALDHLEVSQLDLPGNPYVFFVYLSGERLYTAGD
jgi:hypothetical protein